MTSCTQRSVHEVAGALPAVAVIGAGGIDGPATARAFLAAGAVGVQVGTALLHDPTTVARVRAALHDDDPREDRR